MRAITFAQYGGPEVLRLTDTPTPQPGTGQVRVAVRRAGVNPIDWRIRSGAMADGVELDSPQIPGREVAGVVDAVGDDTEFTIGDEVFGWSATGAYAEFALAATVIRKPADLSWDDAAALPVAGETALRALGLLEIKSGELLVIHGASGAVGRFATQVAVALGATVIGTAGQHNLDEVKALGAIPIRYGDGWLERVREVASRPVDAVLDTSGHGVLPDSVKLRGSNERIVTIADPAAFEMGLQFSAGEDEGETKEVLTKILGYVQKGLRIAHGESYLLEDAAAAQEKSEGGHPGGKLTIVMS